MGAVRSSVSCSNTPAQYAFLKADENPSVEAEKRAFFDMLKRRYDAVKQFIGSHPCPPSIRALPFNSGYFMSFKMNGISAEQLRKNLLAAHGIGAVSFGEEYLRIAFAGIDEAQIESVYSKLYDTAGAMV
jgi:aspartate/methionine/tyrosine aminotransferase